ncbi:MAG: SPFH domain-containing protein [Clostridiales bacterium]|nr:SPFH domain-containing protein [Clostridiales bacterium]
MDVQNKAEERQARYISGMAMLALMVVLAIVSVFLVSWAAGAPYALAVLGWTQTSFMLAAAWLIAAICWAAITFISLGLRILKPNEAYVLTFFGKYYGSLKKEGFFFVNPFAVPTKLNDEESGWKTANGVSTYKSAPRKVSLKAMTLNNEKQKINDQLGNPIEIGIVVIWRVVNTAKAVFNVDDYNLFLSTQCDSALRNIVRMYPYDITGGEDELTLRGSSMEIAEQLRGEIQQKVDIAGLEVMEARITHLAYSPEIAAAMLQRQQAKAIIDARALIVRGAVGMVEQALCELNEHGIVELDNERKAAMVSNLLVVLCGNRDAQPIVNSGSLY